MREHDPRDAVASIHGLQEAACTVAAALFVREGLSATVAAETLAALRREVRHALRVWVPPPDSYRAINLRSLALHEDTLAALCELARGAGRDDLVHALAGEDQPAP